MFTPLENLREELRVTRGTPRYNREDPVKSTEWQSWPADGLF